MLYYEIILSKEAKRDRIRIAKYMKEYNAEKIIKRIYTDIDKLSFMPRIHKTVSYYANPEIEYRRMISGKYSVIYKIVEEQIIILRIFNQRENYLNQRKFILREKSQKYVVIK